MSLAESIKSYGAKKRELVKKNKWSYYATGAGNAMMQVGAELSKFATATAANKLSHEQFQKGAEILDIDASQLEGTTFDAPDEKTSLWGNVKEGLRERLTSAKSMTTAGDMKPDKWYSPSSWGHQANPEDSGMFTGGDREYTAEEISQVGMIYGDTAKAKMARSVYETQKGKDGKDIRELFGNKIDVKVEKTKPFVAEKYDAEDIFIDKSTLDKTDTRTPWERHLAARGGTSIYFENEEQFNKERTSFIEKSKANKVQVDPVDIVLQPDPNILAADPTGLPKAQGYKDFSIAQRKMMSNYFKEFGEAGPKLEKDEDLQYSKTADKMKTMQKLMNEIGMDVGGDSGEWLQYKEKAFGQSSMDAYNLLRTEWASQSEKDWGYMAENKPYDPNWTFDD